MHDFVSRLDLSIQILLPQLCAGLSSLTVPVSRHCAGNSAVPFTAFCTSRAFMQGVFTPFNGFVGAIAAPVAGT